MGVQEALQLAVTYIRYVQSVNPTLHKEADGSPSVLNAVKEALAQYGE